MLGSTWGCFSCTGHAYCPNVPTTRRCTHTQNDDDGSSYRLIVWSEKAVIAACGSLHTPALLLRSGLKHPKIGRHLALVRERSSQAHAPRFTVSQSHVHP